MNSKQNSGIFGRFSFAKLLNVMVILSMLLASCGNPQNHAVSEKAGNVSAKESAQDNNYEPPVYAHPEAVTGERPEISQATTEQKVQGVPIQFIENVGQFDDRVLYQAQTGRQTTFITRDAIWLTVLEEQSGMPAEVSADPAIPEIHSPEDFIQSQEKQTIKGANLKLTFMETNAGIAVEEFIPLDTKISFLGGIEGQNSYTNVSAWGGIRYKNIFSGFDFC